MSGFTRVRFMLTILASWTFVSALTVAYTNQDLFLSGACALVLGALVYGISMVTIQEVARRVILMIVLAISGLVTYAATSAYLESDIKSFTLFLFIGGTIIAGICTLVFRREAVSSQEDYDKSMEMQLLHR